MDGLLGIESALANSSVMDIELEMKKFQAEKARIQNLKLLIDLFIMGLIVIRFGVHMEVGFNFKLTYTYN